LVNAARTCLKCLLRSFVVGKKIGTRQLDDQIPFLTGWHHTTDMYRNLKHTVDWNCLFEQTVYDDNLSD